MNGKSYAEVVALIQRLQHNLSLIVVPKQDDILQMVKKDDIINTDETETPSSTCDVSYKIQ